METFMPKLERLPCPWWQRRPVLAFLGIYLAGAVFGGFVTAVAILGGAS